MTPQEAYNKGLDTAENEAYEKISKAIEGLDVGPFANPKMEELRQRLLNYKPPQNNFILDFFSNQEIDKSQLSSTELKTLELFQFCRRIVPKRPTSKISVGLRDKLRAIEVDILKNSDKLD